jgi:hypothetical protein
MLEGITRTRSHPGARWAATLVKSTRQSRNRMDLKKLRLNRQRNNVEA